MDTSPSPQLGFLRGVFLANHLASTANLTRTTSGVYPYLQMAQLTEPWSIFWGKRKNTRI